MVGEGLDQLYLLIIEWPYDSPVEHKQADGERPHEEAAPRGLFESRQVQRFHERCILDQQEHPKSERICPPAGRAQRYRHAPEQSLGLQVFFVLRRVPIVRGRRVVARTIPVGRRFDPCRPRINLSPNFDQRVEYLLQIERRPADDLEHFGGGGLLLQRFGEVGGALAQFVEQARILDGDDGLGSEARKEGDLLFSERANFLAINENIADQGARFLSASVRSNVRASAHRRRGRTTGLSFEKALFRGVHPKREPPLW